VCRGLQVCADVSGPLIRLGPMWSLRAVCEGFVEQQPAPFDTPGAEVLRPLAGEQLSAFAKLLM